MDDSIYFCGATKEHCFKNVPQEIYKKNVDGFLSIWFSNDNTAVFLRIDQHTFLVIFMDTEPLNITQK